MVPGLFAFLLRHRPHGVEILVAACSLWAGKCYLLPPSNFKGYSASYALAGDLITEAGFGTLQLASGCLSLIGLAAASKVARGAGGVLAAFAWGVVAVSFLAETPDLTVGGLAATLCTASLASLLVLPGDDA